MREDGTIQGIQLSLFKLNIKLFWNCLKWLVEIENHPPCVQNSPDLAMKIHFLDIYILYLPFKKKFSFHHI